MAYRFHNDPLPDEYDEDKPFRMTELDHDAHLADIQEMTDSLQSLSNGKLPSTLRPNRFLGRICLALPLAGLLWYAIKCFVK